MMDVLALPQSILWSGFVVFLRIGAMAAVLPAFGEQMVPMRVRLGAAIAFTSVVAPALQTPDIPTGLYGFVPLLATEVVAGLFFGLCLRFMVHALEMAGTIAAQSTSLSQIFGGTAGADPQPVMGRILMLSGLALACMLGLHVRLAAYILTTYDIVPIGKIISAEVMLDVGQSQISQAFALAFSLSAPFVVGALIYNITLGFINRAMPQLMVSFVGAPAITAGGMLLLLVSAPIMLHLWWTRFDLLLQGVFE